MSKYIDADKLIAEIERLSEQYGDTVFDNVAKAALEKVYSIISSHQQEQEWGEEDEYRLGLLIAMCDDVQKESLKISTSYREMQETKDWLLNRLKSLRPS